MSFKHLEERLEKGDNRNKESYLELNRQLQEPTKSMFGYLLDISSLMKSRRLQNEYLIFGGYAVLSHLIRSYGPNIAINWRGSSDIDMAGSENVLRVLSLEHEYEVKSNLRSPNLKDKYTIKLHETDENECKIDFYLGNFKEKFGDFVRNEHFGILVNVVEPISLIRGKLETPDDQPCHGTDILGLLSVLERNGYAPKEVADHYKGNEVDVLRRKITKADKSLENTRISIQPSKKFMKELKEQLHKRRCIK